MIYDPNGPDGRAMDGHRVEASTAKVEAARPPRSAAEGAACGLEWHSLGASDWGAVERDALEVPAVPDMPSLVPALERERHFPHRASSARDGPQRTRRIRPEGRLRGRLLQRGEKRGPCVGKTKRGKGTKIMAATDGAGLPLAISIASASPHEVKLIEEALDQSLIDELPDRLIGDKAYDSDRLDERLWLERGVKLIAPHRRGRRTATQDGRELRRYRRRWQVERLFAWFHFSRRLVIRYERKAINFLGFLHIACSLILLRQF
jgi:transposase